MTVEMTPGTDDGEARGCTVRLSDHFAKVSARYRTLRELDFEAVRIVSDVVARAVDLGIPVRLVDVATGSGRYLDAVNHCLGHCPKLVCHLPIFWSYWRYKARHRAGSDPCCEVCRRRARVGRAQSPPVGGGRVARYRLRRRRGGFVGHRSGSGDDSQGTPGDFPRRGADGPHPTPWRRKASHPAGSTRHRGRARSLGGSARGDPTSPLRWTCKSRAKLAAA